LALSKTRKKTARFSCQALAHDPNMKIEPKKKSEIINAIERVEAFDLKTISIIEIENEFKSLLKGFKIVVPRYNPGIYLYRGRICDKPLNISNVIYPPQSVIKCLGRANNIGQQLFYTANSRNVPFYELSANVDDHIAIGTWKTKSKMVLNHIGFTDECKTCLKSDRDLGIIYKFVTDMNNFGDSNVLLHNYLASKFTPMVKKNEEWRYKLSVAIANIFLTGNVIHGIMYPTIAMLGNADNVVLKPDFYMDSMDFVSIEYAVITKKDGMRYSWDILDSATKLDKSGNFMWSGRHLQWRVKKDGKYTMKREAGNDVLYDEDGNRIDPY